MKEMKKVLFLCVLLFSLILINAQDMPQTPPIVEEETAKKIQEFGEKIPLNPETGKPDQEKLKPWKSKAEERIEWLNNNTKFLKPITKYSIGEEFALSFRFLLAFFIWCFFVMAFFVAINGYSSLSEGVSLGIALALGVVLGNLGFIKKIIDLIGYLLKSWWTWSLAIIIIIVLIIIEIKFGKILKERRKKMKEMMREIKMEEGERAAEALSEAAKGLEKD